MIKKNYADIITGVFLIVFSGIIYFIILPIQVDQTPGPGLSAAFFPKLILWSLVLNATVIIVLNVLNQDENPQKNKQYNFEWGRRERKLSLSVMTVCVLYVYFMDILGYLVATPLSLGGLMLLLGARRWMTIFVSVFLYTFILYVVFGYLLNINLPQGILF